MSVLEDASGAPRGFEIEGRIPLKTLQSEGPEKVVGGILASILGNPAFLSAGQGFKDIDEDSESPEDNSQALGLSDFLNEALGKQEPQPQTDGSGDQLGDLLGNLLGQGNTGKPALNFDDLFKEDEQAPEKPNRIVVPEERNQLADLLDSLGQGSAGERPCEQQPRNDLPLEDLLQKFNPGNYKESDAEAEEPSESQMNDIVQGILGGDGSEPRAEDSRLQRLRDRLPKVDFNAPVPLMNNFYGIRKIRNGPTVYPPLGHRRRAWANNGPAGFAVSHHRRRHSVRSQSLQRQRVVGGPVEAGMPDLGALLGKILGGAGKMVRI
jgi:hypothetical protein